MRLYIMLFAIGAWLLQREAALPDMRYAWWLLLAVPVYAATRAHVRAVKLSARAALSVAWLTAGFFWAATWAHVRMADALAPEWEGRDITLVGVVASLPQPFERNVRFELDVEQVLTADAIVPQRIVLSWWGRGVSTTTEGRDAASLPQAHPGERWRFTVRLKRPHGSLNPHGYDHEAALLERGVRATGYIRPGLPFERLDAVVHRPAYWVEIIRERLRTRILSALNDRPYAGVIAALVMGDQRAIPLAQWQTFTRTGVNHLMSISGLHVTMVSGLGWALAFGLWRRSARLTLWLPAAKAAALAGALTALIYTLLAGFAVPAQRTLYMICVVAIALWTGAGASASVVLAMALMVVVLIDPWAVSSAGFWLSFGAVAAIFFAVVNRVGQPHWLILWLRTQAAVTLALLPLLLALFQQVSLISPFANAFAIPIVSLIVVPLALIGSALPFDVVLLLAHEVMRGCMLLLDWMSARPNAVWQQHAPVAWTIVAAVSGAFWMLCPRGMPARWLGLIACLPLFLVIPPGPRMGEARVTVLDVGQGLAVVVRTAQRTLLFDSGPGYGAGVDSGNRIIVPYLRATGVRTLDGFVISHDDADHTGGALSVLQALPVAWLASSLPDMDPLPMISDEAFPCVAGRAWVWDEVRFELLHPLRESVDGRVKNNDRGCVLKVSAPGGSVLIPADIERRSEEALLARGAALSADVIVAGHHGSRTSSTAAFIEAVRPRAVVFAVGYRNRFGHPHADVVERYRAHGSAAYRTDTDGAVMITIQPQAGVSIARYRAQHRRYWLDAPSADAREPVMDSSVCDVEPKGSGC